MVEPGTTKQLHTVHYHFISLLLLDSLDYVGSNNIGINILILYLFLLVSFDFSTFCWWFVFLCSSLWNHLSFCLSIKCCKQVRLKHNQVTPYKQYSHVFTTEPNSVNFCHHVTKQVNETSTGGVSEGQKESVLDGLEQTNIHYFGTVQP